MSTKRLTARLTATLRYWWTVFVLLSACSPSHSTLFAETQQRTVDRVPPPRIQVLRPDVLVIDGQHLRLADAQTPQPSPSAHCTAEAVAARQAYLRLKGLAEGVSTASIRRTGRVDSDQRAYAHVYLDGVDPALALINEGLAVSGDGQRIDWCAPLSTALPEAERIAELSAVG